MNKFFLFDIVALPLHVGGHGLIWFEIFFVVPAQYLDGEVTHSHVKSLLVMIGKRLYK